MITKLRLENFKSFKDETLFLGPFNILIGTNASGKSNLRDAFRFLHGISRGYLLSDIIGVKYGAGGNLEWQGIRGGPLEATYQKAFSFTITIDFNIEDDGKFRTASYKIEVEPGTAPLIKSRVVSESLYVEKEMIFDSNPKDEPLSQEDAQHINVRIMRGGNYKRGHLERLISNQPVLTQIDEKSIRPRLENKKDLAAKKARDAINRCISVLGPMRFLDLSPDVMRLPSLPGQTVLGDRGENLSSVLQAICEDPIGKLALTEWIKELTPMDAQNFEFPSDFTGKILVNLVEENGQRTSAYSASDGTLRFLAMIAALIGPDHARFYFFEELENGIHPTRINLLLSLIEQRVKQNDIQIITSTHSPQLLRSIKRESLEYAALLYRLPGHVNSRIQRLIDLPNQEKQVLLNKDIANLYESGWFETTMTFLQDFENYSENQEGNE
ncbi:MAG: AAA family ATPase [Bacteroidales bacterium]